MYFRYGTDTGTQINRSQVGCVCFDGAILTPIKQTRTPMLLLEAPKGRVNLVLVGGLCMQAILGCKHPGVLTCTC